MSFPKILALLFCLITLSLGAGCKRQPSLPSAETWKDGQGLRLVRGLEIILSQSSQVEEGELAEGEGPWLRKLTVLNPSGAEGLSFTWEMNSEDSSSGKMVLANTVGARRMTLPLFWPGGELFLSNSSAVWLSDQAFQELKKEGKTHYDLGLVDKPILGPAQGLLRLEKGLEAYGQSLSSRPEKKFAALEWKVSSKALSFPLKVGGVSTAVQAFEAVSPLARIKVLDNPQNPLVLQVEVAPPTSAATSLFLPLSWLRGLLDYRVEALQTPAS